jgi:translation initiation factor 2 alpha subunit (eIF-2alpha)
MSDKTPLAKAQAKYEKEKRGKVVVKVALSSSDDPAEWQAIADGLKDKYGTVKNAIREIAKEKGII